MGLALDLEEHVKWQTTLTGISNSRRGRDHWLG